MHVSHKKSAIVLSHMTKQKRQFRTEWAYMRNNSTVVVSN